jgi:hypothetical protein
MRSDMQNQKKWLGIVLVTLSFAFYGCLLLVPLISFSTENKILLSTLLVIFGETSFWLAVVFLGRDAIAKYGYFAWRFKWLKKP